MKQEYYLIFGIIAIIAVTVISGCVQQKVATPPTSEEDTITNQCIEELNALENKFGLNREDVKILSSECSTCSPWYTPQVARFNATIEKEGKRYNLFFSDTCYRHEQNRLSYTIISDEKTGVYEEIKERICTDFSDWINYLHKCQDETNIDRFISCINQYSNYIELGVINVTEDWDYCSTNGWKDCDEWNTCEPGGPSNSSICTPEYCKMSCLCIYSDRRIQKHFTELCNKWEKVGEGKFIFSFDIPEDIREIISLNYLK
jgi:hypothetical protein